MGFEPMTNTGVAVQRLEPLGYEVITLRTGLEPVYP